MKYETEISKQARTFGEWLIDFLIFLSIFLGSSIVFFKTPFEGYFHYVIYLLLLPFFISRYGVPKTPFKLLLLPLIVGVFQVAMGNNEPFLFVKIFIGVLLSVTFYYYVCEYYERDVDKMFRLYLTWAYWSAIIAIIQYVSFKAGFRAGYDYHWLLNKGGSVVSAGGIRVSSIFLEPSQLGIMLGPAAFVAAINMLRGQKYHYKFYHNIVILVALYLSRSSTGYLGLFLVFVIMGINYGYLVYLLLFIVFGLLAAWGLYNSVDEFRARVDSSVGLWLEGDLSIENANSSSFVLYNNTHIAWENLKEHPLFGSGLGSHPVAYEKYSYTKTGAVWLKGFEFNTADANSLFLRTMSELGVAGLVFLFFIIIRCFVGYQGDDDNRYWIISGALLVIVLLYMFRQGNYFLNGFPFFMWLYYYTREVFLEHRQDGLAKPLPAGASPA
jgi:hypothetical protein